MVEPFYPTEPISQLWEAYLNTEWRGRLRSLCPSACGQTPSVWHLRVLGYEPCKLSEDWREFEPSSDHPQITQRTSKKELLLQSKEGTYQRSPSAWDVDPERIIDPHGGLGGIIKKIRKTS